MSLVSSTTVLNALRMESFPLSHGSKVPIEASGTSFTGGRIGGILLLLICVAVAWTPTSVLAQFCGNVITGQNFCDPPGQGPASWGMDKCVMGGTAPINRSFCEIGGGIWNPTTTQCSGLADPPFHPTSPYLYRSNIVDEMLEGWMSYENTCGGGGTITAVDVPSCEITRQVWDGSFLTEEFGVKNTRFHKRISTTCVETNDDFRWYHLAPVACPTGSSLQRDILGKPYCLKTIGDACPVGNPVDPASGEKLHVESTALGIQASDLLRLYYRSYGDTLSRENSGLISGFWRFGFDRRLAVFDANSLMLYAGGREPHMFRKAADGVYSPVSVTRHSGMRIVANGSGFDLTDTDLVRWQFDGLGRVVAIVWPDGRSQTLTWGNGIATLTDEKQRSTGITIADIQSQINPPLVPPTPPINFISGKDINILSPANELVNVKTNIHGQVTSITTASGTRTFQYEDTTFKTGLTGLTDEDGVRHRRYTYAGKKVSEEFIRVNGVDIRQFAYSYSGDQITITNQMNQTSTANIVVSAGVRRLGSQSNNCASCGANTMNNTYDANGHLDSSIDLRGILTDLTIDPVRGLETERVEAKSAPGVPNPAAKRTIQTDWHATLRVPIQKRYLNNTNVLEQVKTWTYNGRGQVTAQCKHAPEVAGATGYACGSQMHAPVGVRQTRHAYCELPDLQQPATGCAVVGQIRTVDGPRTDVADITTSSYYLADDAGCASGQGSCAFRRGDLKDTINALGHTTTYLQYDRAGRVKRIRDPNGVLTDLTYDNQGRMTHTTIRANANGAPSAADSTTEIRHDITGEVDRVTQADGSFTEYVRDDAHRLTSIVDNLGNRVIYTLDAGGNRVREEIRDPGNVLRHLLAAQFDGFSRVRSQINAPYAGQQNLDHPSVKKTTFIFDMNGNLDLRTDPLGRVIEHMHDELNRLQETVEDHGVSGLNATTRIEYDTRDNISRITDPKSLATIYTYDGLDDLKAQYSPDTGTIAFEVDGAGNRVLHTDARGIPARMQYDSLNRLTLIEYPNSAENTTYEYDNVQPTCGPDEQFGTSRLTRFTDESGETALCYDHRGNIVRKIQVIGGASLEVQYTYSSTNQVTGVRLPGGRWINYGRDGVGRTTSISMQHPNSASVPIVNNVNYLPFGPISGIHWADGGSLLRGFDQNYWPEVLQSSRTTGLSAAFDTNDLGNITGIQAAAPVSTSIYEYDRMNRLAAVTRNGLPVDAYSYDATGNRTSHNGTSYKYENNSHRLNRIGTAERAYDESGNLVNQSIALLSGKGFNYSARNRLTSLEFNGMRDSGYLYNARGERVYKETPFSITLFLYDESGKLLGEYDYTGQVLNEYVWLDSLPVALLTDRSWMPIEPDHLGSPRRVIDSARGLAVWSWDLQGSAFGNDAPSEDPDLDSIQFQLNLRFPGQYFDAESGLHHNGFRDYEPSTGRYLEGDPIGLYGGVSSYSYANSNPLNSSDEYGLRSGTAMLGPVPAGRPPQQQTRLPNPYNPALCFSDPDCAPGDGGFDTSVGCGLWYCCRGGKCDWMPELTPWCKDYPANMCWESEVRCSEVTSFVGRVGGGIPTGCSCKLIVVTYTDGRSTRSQGLPPMDGNVCKGLKNPRLVATCLALTVTSEVQNFMK